MGFAWGMGGVSVPIVGAFADGTASNGHCSASQSFRCAPGRSRYRGLNALRPDLCVVRYRLDDCQTMPRRPRLSTISYSFGPGPITPAVRALLYANGIVYLVSLFYTPLYEWFGLVPKHVVQDKWLWQVATYMFLHARTPTHILFNMLILWMFGVELERMWRTKFFVKYYFVTGVGAGIISVLISLLPFDATQATYDAVI